MGSMNQAMQPPNMGMGGMGGMSQPPPFLNPSMNPLAPPPG